MMRSLRKMLVASLCVLVLTPSAWGTSRDRLMTSVGHPDDDFAVRSAGSTPWSGMTIVLPIALGYSKMPLFIVFRTHQKINVLTSVNRRSSTEPGGAGR